MCDDLSQQSVEVPRWACKTGDARRGLTAIGLRGPPDPLRACLS